MNVRPGDLAVIVAPYCDEGRGRVVTVVRRAKDGRKYSGRKFEADSFVGVGWVCRGHIVLGGVEFREWPIADECLRPIRDPGDDAVDETLTWKDVPSTTKETA